MTQVKVLYNFKRKYASSYKYNYVRFRYLFLRILVDNYAYANFFNALYNIPAIIIDAFRNDFLFSQRDMMGKESFGFFLNPICSRFYRKNPRKICFFSSKFATINKTNETYIDGKFKRARVSNFIIYLLQLIH